MTTARQVRDALRKRFAPPAWAVFDEVRSTTGHTKQPRYVDVLALSLYPSRGIDLHGIEIKVSRSDWIRERDNPEKAETIAAYCDRWWLAVSDAEIVKDGELPVGWGLLVLKGEKLFTVKGAPELAPKPLDRNFVAAVLRCAADREAAMRAQFVAPDEVRRRVEEALAESDVDRRRTWEWESQQELVKLRRQLDWVERFREDTGIDPNMDWHLRGPLREIAEALAPTYNRYNNTLNSVMTRLESEAKTLRNGLAAIESALASLETKVETKGTDHE